MNTPYCLILFRKAGFELDQAQALLSEKGFFVRREEQRLWLCCQDGPLLRLYFAEGADVLSETIDIGKDTAHANILSCCEQRFEISFDDLDEVLDETNTLIEVQLSLQDATGGFIFNSWNGALIPPESAG